MKKLAIAIVLTIIAVQAIGGAVTTKAASSNMHNAMSHRMAQIDSM